jgi:hypothetical protein
VIGGAQKSATTSLFRLLDQHPDVSTPVNKEPQFFAFSASGSELRGPGADAFARTIVTDEGDYRRLFAGGQRHQHRLEASTLYLSEPGVPERLMAFDPSVKIIFVLRDPADRAYSAFSYFRLQGLEPLASVLEGVEAEEERLAAGWPPHFGYARLSRYGDHLDRWFGLVPREQILCLAQRELADEPEDALGKVEEFLGLPHFDGYTAGVRHNASGHPRSPLLQKLLDIRFPLRSQFRKAAPRFVQDGVVAMRNRNLARPVGLTAQERSTLVELFAPQVDIVRDLLGDDITAGWDQP